MWLFLAIWIAYNSYYIAFFNFECSYACAYKCEKALFCSVFFLTSWVSIFVCACAFLTFLFEFDPTRVCNFLQDQPGDHTCGYCGLRFHLEPHHWSSARPEEDNSDWLVWIYTLSSERLATVKKYFVFMLFLCFLSQRLRCCSGYITELRGETWIFSCVGEFVWL